MEIPEEATRDAIAVETHLKRSYPELAEVRFGGWETGPGEGRWAFKRAENALALIVFSPETGVQEVHGGIAEKWILSGGPAGPLGLPTTWEEGSAEERWGNFQHGKIRWKSGGGQPDIFPIEADSEMKKIGAEDLTESPIWRFLPEARSKWRAALNHMRETQNNARELEKELLAWQSFDRTPLLCEIEKHDKRIRELSAELSKLAERASSLRSEGQLNPNTGDSNSRLRAIFKWISSGGARAMALCLDAKARKPSRKLQSERENKEQIEATIKEHDAFDWIIGFFRLGNAQATHRKATLSLLRVDTSLREVTERIRPVGEEILKLEKEMPISSDLDSIPQIDAAIKDAEQFDHQLATAICSRDRWQVHSDCEKRYGLGSPKRVMGILRTKKKLLERIEGMRGLASVSVHKILVDGSNIRPEGAKLDPRFPVALANELASRYSVVLFFDALWGKNRKTVKNALNPGVKLCPMQGTKADEIILAEAEGNQDCFVVSNDRFRDYCETDAVKNRRILRYEITPDYVFVPKLGVRAKVPPSEH